MRVYLSGGMKDGWQDHIKRDLPGNLYLDPRDHGLNLAKDYTKKDLEMIDECDVVWAYLPLTNPSGIGLAAELGYAKAKGKPIFLAIEHKEKKWDFVKALADEWVGGSEEYPLYLNFLSMLSGRAVEDL